MTVFAGRTFAGADASATSAIGGVTGRVGCRLMKEWDAMPCVERRLTRGLCIVLLPIGPDDTEVD
jgi:hypothetical protein